MRRRSRGVYLGRIYGYTTPKSSRRTSGQGESFLGRKWLIGKKIKKELDKPEGISHTKMV